MSRIVVLSTIYLNIPSANGICARNLVDALRERGNDVIVVCYEDKSEEEKDEFILTIPRPYLNETHTAIQKIIRTVQVAMHSTKPIFNQEMIDAYIKRLNEVNKAGKIDAIIAMYFPFESVEAMRIFCKDNPGVKSFIFELDSVGDGVSNSQIKALYNRAYERWLYQVYSEVTAAVIMRSHIDYWMSIFGKQFGSKVKVVDIPVLQQKEYTLVQEHESIRMIYSGLIEKRYRSPSYLLQVIKELEKTIDIDFSFYSKGDCEDEIKQAAMSVGGIRQFGYVPPDKLEKAIQDSDYLVSIGNTFSKSVPSKLISYISYGKPIIHFSSQEDDICNEYLQRYPLTLIIDQSKPIDDSIEKINSFLIETRKKHVAWETIVGLYRENCPSYSAKIIIDLI
jgi:hypothetical protein